MPASTVSLNPRIFTRPKRSMQSQVTSAVSLLCSSNIHTPCLCCIQTLVSWTLPYPLSPCLQLHDVQIPILGSSQGALCIASPCMLYSPFIHALSMYFLPHTHEVIHTAEGFTLCAVQSSLSHAQCTQLPHKQPLQLITAPCMYFHCIAFLVPFHCTTLCYSPNTASGHLSLQHLRACVAGKFNIQANTQCSITSFWFAQAHPHNTKICLIQKHKNQFWLEFVSLHKLQLVAASAPTTAIDGLDPLQVALHGGCQQPYTCSGSCALMVFVFYLIRLKTDRHITNQQTFY